MRDPAESVATGADPQETDPAKMTRGRIFRATIEFPPAILKRRLPKSIFVAAVLLGIVLRISVSSLGHNFDLESYVVVASVVDAGENVYNETNRYNYGPVWLHVIGTASRMARIWDDQFGFFKFFLSFTLTIADLGLCLLLRRRAGDGVAILFFLNPVSIVISGFHRQFGNLALLLGLVAADLFDRSALDRLDWRKWLGMVVLGVSLTTKHILFAFPLWLAIKQRRPMHRVAVLLVPVAVFLLSFIPYWSTGSRGIIDNVFLYRSFENAPLWFGLMPPLISASVPATLGMLVALMTTGLLFRRISAFESVLLYTAVLLVFSPAIANQYLALAMPYVAWFMNPFGIAYALGATVLLAISADGLALSEAVELSWLNTWGFAILITTLLLSLVWVFRHHEMTAAVRKAGRWFGRELHLLLRS